jgi:hypothetical protein
VGWFAIACVSGFFGYWAWRWLAPWLAAQHQITIEAAEIRSAVIAFATVIIGLILWTILFQHVRTAGEIPAVLYNGYVARSLLGLALGAGAAFVIAQRSGPVAAAGTPQFGILPTHLVLSMGIGILTLALVAPYVDGWFQRLTGIKSPFIELQLGAGATTHRVSVAQGENIFFTIQSLKFLQNYNDRIQGDIDYFTAYGKGPNNKNLVDSAKALLPAFKDVIKPVATCVQTALTQGWLSTDSARQIISPTAELLEQIIFAEDVLDQRGEQAKHDQFWQLVMTMPDKVQSRVRIPECTAPRDIKNFPTFQKYQNLPYLHAAAALFISFMGDGDKALQVLQKASDLYKPNGQPVLDFKDYTFLLAMGHLSYFQGRSSKVTSYFDPFNEMRAIARSRIEQLERKRECEADLSPICYAQIYEIVALNQAAYYLAEDLARGNEEAKGYTARIGEYAREIKHVVDEVDNHTAKSNYFYGSYVKPDMYALLDTYAYATLVVEAEKPNPDYGLIRKEVIDVLKRVVEHVEEQIPKHSSKIDALDIAQLKIIQAHLASARQLVGE